MAIEIGSHLKTWTFVKRLKTKKLTAPRASQRELASALTYLVLR